MRRMRASVVGLVVAAIGFACDSSPTAPPTAPPTLSNRGALASLTSQLKGSTKQIAQVNDALAVLGYLQTYVKFNKHPWSQGTQYVAAVLLHFSNYAVAW